MSKSSQKARKATPRKIDRRLFDEIGAEVETHTDKYKNAGKWLDEYCSEREWRERKRTELKANRRRLKALTNELRSLEKEHGDQRLATQSIVIDGLKRRIRNKQEDVDRLSREIERLKVPLQIRFGDAWQYLVKTYKGRKPVTVEDARRIILISWLLLEHHTKTIAGGITEFALWPWKMRVDWDSRSYAAACFWRGSHSRRWKKLMMRALKRVRLQALKESPEDKAEDEVNLVVTLDVFMRDYCELKGHDIASKRELICKMNRQRRITLPPRPQGAGEWKSGQRFVFYAHDLTANWDAYRKVMPTLPLLKARKSAT